MDETKVEIKKDNQGFGLNIIGGSDTPLGGVFVQDIATSGAVAKDGRIKEGDR